MSTTAVIFCKSGVDTFNGISVHFDGYLDGGVGEMLATHWNNPKDIQLLCELDKQIRCFGKDLDEVEFFNDDKNPLCRKQIRALKGLTYEQMNNQCGNYNYAYLWDIRNITGEYEWFFWKDDYTFKPVKFALEAARPCH